MSVARRVAARCSMRTALLVAALVAASGCKSPSWDRVEDPAVAGKLSDLADDDGPVLPRELPELERLLERTRGDDGRALLFARMNRIAGIEATRALARREPLLSAIEGPL